MSWLYSRALVEEFLAGTCSDGEPFAPSSGTPMPQAYWSHAKTTAPCPLFRFGMTSRHLTDDRGEAVLTWFLEDSLAKTSVPPARAPESTASEVECGHTWPESFAKWSPDTSSWKTAQCSLLEGLDVFSGTWPRWGTMRDGACLAHVMQERHTVGIGSGLWLTPKASEARAERYTMETSFRHFQERSHQTSLSQQVLDPRMWPNLGTTVHQSESGGGKLNPTWVEWLMGWPLGWTDLRPLGTDKFRQWREWHSR